MPNNKPRYLLAATAFRIPHPLQNPFVSTPLDRISHNSIELLEEQPDGERRSVAAFHGLATRIQSNDSINEGNTAFEHGNDEIKEKKEILAIGQLHDFLIAYCIRKPPEFPHDPPFSEEEIYTIIHKLHQVIETPTHYYDMKKDYEGAHYEKGYWLPHKPQDQVILYGEKPGEYDALRLWDRLRMLRDRINDKRLHYSALGVGWQWLWKIPTNSNAMYTLALKLMELPLYEFPHLIAPGIRNPILDEKTIESWIQECKQKEQADNAVMQGAVSDDAANVLATEYLRPKAS